MSTNKCFVRGCCNRIGQEISFFGFPQNVEMLKKWKANLRIAESLQIPCHVKICKIHFEPHFIGKNRLYINAIPTLNLGFNDGLPPYLGNPSKASSKFKRCAIKHCRKPSSEVRMFRVPFDPIIRRKWLSICNIPYNDKGDLRLCDKHFQSDQLGQLGLRPNAFPTLNLVKEESIFIECATICNGSGDELQSSLAILTESDIKLEEITQDDKGDLRLCEKHFESDQLGQLGPNAFPTFNLVKEESISIECATICNGSGDELQNSLPILTEPDIKLEQITQEEEEFMNCSSDELEKSSPTTALQPQYSFLQNKLYEQNEEFIECSTSEETSNAPCCLLLKQKMNKQKMTFVKKENLHRKQNANLQKQINNMKKYIAQLEKELHDYRQKEITKQI